MKQRLELRARLRGCQSALEDFAGDVHDNRRIGAVIDGMMLAWKTTLARTYLDA